MPQLPHYNFGQRSQTSHPHWCHRTSLHSLHLQQLYTAVKKHIRRSSIWLLHDHLQWHFWITHTRRWRIWEWEWKLKYSYSSMYNTTPISHLSKWKLDNPITFSLEQDILVVGLSIIQQNQKSTQVKTCLLFLLHHIHIGHTHLNNIETSALYTAIWH